MNLEVEVARLLREGRVRASRSLDEVAVTLGLTREQLLDYESGRASVPGADLYKLVSAYAIRDQLEDLIDTFAGKTLEDSPD